ncbi:ATP-dependent zinc metalloprotease FtsH [Thermomicrobiaceae bacterium CFH 74404]|uniref:ATP-dependent zinc metalloprotease FtsH n=1 Tax=Thermalbibacter longus TaxID=2951981 RepID=A0AA42BAW5_9BACT|nr:ATP-dependent zinc metalloprotease FtsH [Thermalbibacter longus]MCM8750301.1 ATP-dependent zinc metalloprotease FtsH [Thermalbibacter longus]
MADNERNRRDRDPDTRRPFGFRTVRRLLSSRYGLLWLILALVVFWNVYAFLRPRVEEQPTIPYSTFVEAVEQGLVQEATISNQTVQGRFTQPVRIVEGQLIQPGEPLPPGVDERSGTMVTRFRTNLAENTQPQVIELLQANGVHPINVEPGGGSALPSLLLGFLPFLILLGLLVLLGRNLSRGQQNVFSFGRSRARVYDVERPRVTFADVAGEEEAKAELTQVVDFLRNPAKYHRIGARLPRGVLLIGPPGTGKTLLARAVAGEAGVPFFSVSASEFVEMFVGVGASRVRDLFERAKAQAPSIIFIDELDAVGRQRFAGLGVGNDEREQTLNQLLVEMDGFEAHHDVVVIAATNRPDVLDPALLRPGRFDRQVTVGLPDRRGRLAILRIHARGIPVAPDVDFDSLAAATPGFSGADLANLVNEAALVAARRGKEIVDRADFEEALDKILLGTTRSMLMSEEERRVVAYHEAGHAVVAYFTPGSDPLRKISIVPRGRSLGVTVQTPEEDRFNYTKSQLFGRLAVLLGGRAAEELVFHEVSTGAQNDLKEATQLARRMVGLWGMSEEIGPLYLGLGEQHVFLGREIAQDHQIAETTLDRVDAAVQRILNSAKEQAQAILIEHRHELDRLADLLVIEETVGPEKIREVLGEVPARTPTGAAAGADE